MWHFLAEFVEFVVVVVVVVVVVQYPPSHSLGL